MDDLNVLPPTSLEHQSSFVEGNDQAAAPYRSQTVAPARSNMMEEDKEMQEDILEEKGAFAEMFEYHVKNLVEFVDKRGTPQRKHQLDKMNDIVLYIQDETDFYQAWENVFRGEVNDY